MINIQSWEEKINNCQYDNAVGIRIAKLASYNNFSTFITKIDPNKSVNPHYHKHGDEHYHVISGTGIIRLKDVINGTESLHKISSQQSFTVPENMEHQLSNIGEQPLLLMFSCPDFHLDNDRYFL